MAPGLSGRPSWLPGAAGIAAVVGYMILFLAVESQTEVALLLAGGAAALFAAARLGVLHRVQASFAEREGAMHWVALVGVLVLAGFFYDDHFTLLLVTIVLIFTTAALGLTVQFGFAGVLNFAGSSFMGVGCYTAAVLTAHTGLPHVLVLFAGGAMASLIGALLLFPVLRTRGHYSAVITIAFALLFKTFLEVNDTLGGPQGLHIESMTILGWELNSNVTLGPLELSFYFNYALVALALLAAGFAFVRRVERSWIGLNMDAVRLDETATACFGYDIARWKITAFTIGNFFAGTAGALYAMVLGFIAPTNFTFGDSLILVSIVLLGGVGNPWGIAVATVILVVLPEKLQIIQEYRFLLFSALVILILLYRPLGLLPRPLRTYFPGWQPK